MNKKMRKLYLASLADRPEPPEELRTIQLDLQEDFDMYAALLCEYVWTCGYDCGKKRRKQCKRK